MAYQSFVDAAQSALPSPQFTMPNPKGLNAIRAGAQAIPGVATDAVPSALGKVGTGLLGRAAGAIGTGLKFASGPIGMGIAAAQQILKAKPLNEGENEKLHAMGINLGPEDTANLQLPPQPAVAPWIANPSDWSQAKPLPETNSVTPLAAPATELDTSGPVVIPSLPSQPQPQSIGTIPQGGTNLGELLKTIQTVQPAEDYAHRVNALSSGNTTWDMDSLAKIIAAREGQKADTERYGHQIGALTGLGSTQMTAEAARQGHLATLAGHQAQRDIERQKNAAMGPLWEAQAREANANAKAKPLETAGKIIQEAQARALTNKDKLEQATKILDSFGINAPTDPSAPGYLLYHQAKYVFDTLSGQGK